MLNIDDRLIKEVCPKIKPNALSVLLAIAIHLNQKTNRCFPSHERIMALTGLGRDAVYGALQVLKENKLLVSHQPIDEKTKQFGRRTFRLTTRFVKIFVDAEDADPLPENPHTETPDTVEPDTANQETKPLNNNKQINQLEQISEEEKKGASLSSTSSPENETLEAKEKENDLHRGVAGEPCPNCNGAGWYVGRNGRETCNRCLGVGLDFPLQPPFAPTGETIEHRPTTIVRLYENDLPGVTVIDGVPGTYETKQDPRTTPPAEICRVNIQEEIKAMRTDQAALEGFVIGRKLPREKFAEYLSDFEAEQIGLKTNYKNERELRLHFLNWSGVHHQVAQQKATKHTGNNRSHITNAGGDLSKYNEPQKF